MQWASTRSPVEWLNHWITDKIFSTEDETCKLYIIGLENKITSRSPPSPDKTIPIDLLHLSHNALCLEAIIQVFRLSDWLHKLKCRSTHILASTKVHYGIGATSIIC